MLSHVAVKEFGQECDQPGCVNWYLFLLKPQEKVSVRNIKYICVHGCVYVYTHAHTNMTERIGDAPEQHFRAR